MRYASVLLVNFYYPESGYGDKLLFPPLGLGYISEYLETHGIQTDVLDMGTGKKMNQAEHLIIQKIDEYDPKLISITLNSICFPTKLDVNQSFSNSPPSPGVSPCL